MINKGRVERWDLGRWFAHPTRPMVQNADYFGLVWLARSALDRSAIAARCLALFSSSPSDCRIGKSARLPGEEASLPGSWLAISFGGLLVFCSD